MSNFGGISYYLSQILENARNNPVKFLKSAFFWIIALTGSLTFGVGVVFLYQVYFGDQTYLTKSTILAKINEETQIYYLDNTTQVGSFFEDMHRRYVPIEDIPQHMVDALIASEDKYFYEHNGINPVAIFKALSEGIAGALSSGFRSIHFRGGSTITQQTVKNILDQREYSVSRKFREAIASLQLERMYSKKQIVEFYLNQFHVTSNGNGVGIAAKYYFDKDISELELVECAFIAGSVKAPSHYNPFMKYTKEDRDRAQLRANDRKNYVIKQMLEQGLITQEQYDEAFLIAVPFKKGTFATREVSLVSLIRGQLKKPEILGAIGLETIEDLTKAGFKIFTTIDHRLQEDAQLAMRRNLSRLETILQGFKPEPPENYKPQRDLEVNQFYYAKVEKIDTSKSEAEVHLDLGLSKAVIPFESIVRYAKLLDIADGRGWQVKVQTLLQTVKPGDTLFVEILSYDGQTHHGVAELHKRPEVNGALVVLDKGEIRAVVNGFDSLGYNRAIFGKRQPGSVFKTLVYYAAVQLGWSILDTMDNSRQLFAFQDQFYFPQPDHVSPYTATSIVWAGTKSENLASIDLTYRLVDKLSLQQFTALMHTLGLKPEPGESEPAFHYRVAKETGVQLDQTGIRHYQLQKALRELTTEASFGGDATYVETLRKMWWGANYVREMQNVYKADHIKFSVNEKQIRLGLLRNNLERYRLLRTHAESSWQQIQSVMTEKGFDAALQNPQVKEHLAKFRIVPTREGTLRLAYQPQLPGEDPPIKTHSAGALLPVLVGRDLNSSEIESVWMASDINEIENSPFNFGRLLLDGKISVDVLNAIENRISEFMTTLASEKSAYDYNLYYEHHDFRIALGLQYLKHLTVEMGVFSDVEPVLSFALGTNVVSVAEVAKIYQTFTEGKIYRFSEKGPANQLNLIRRIEDRNGTVIFEPKVVEHVLTQPRVHQQIQQVLRKVVTHGTGRRANTELYIRDSQAKVNSKTKALPQIRIPSFGKTGTTNDYRTASFAGFLPYPTAKGETLDSKNSYTIAAYVGYDLNKEMRRGLFKVGGAQGALPVWTDVAKAIIDKEEYTSQLDLNDIGVLATKTWPLAPSLGFDDVRVDLPRGSILQNARSTAADAQEAVTDFAKTGEAYVNEFADHAPVEASVLVPRGKSSVGFFEPLRSVSFFQKAPFFDETQNQMVSPSVVQPEKIDVTADPALQEQPSAIVKKPTRESLPTGWTSGSKVNPGKPESVMAEERKDIPDAVGRKPDKPGVILPKAPEVDPATLPPVDSKKATTDIPRDDELEDTGFIEEELW